MSGDKIFKFPRSDYVDANCGT